MNKIDQVTDEILAEFFSITNVPADKIEMVRNWMRPVIMAGLAKCSTLNMTLQEINQATAETQLESPVISTREAHTQVLVKDGQTIVLGGLRDQQHDRNRNGVPFLSRIPILGGLFGSASRIDSETELFLFLTPRILRTDDDVEQATRARISGSGEGGR